MSWLSSAKSVFLGVALLLIVFSASAKAYDFRYVIIDAGHGGHDNGAIGNGLREKDLTLAIAKRLEVKLRKKGYRTAMTRRGNYFISLGGRANKANRYRRAIFVSIHINSAPSSRAYGIETFYIGSTSAQLASSVQRQLIGRIRTRNRGIKTRRFAVLRKTKMPAILVECGFISNAWEAARLRSAWYQEAIADEIADGIHNFRRGR